MVFASLSILAGLLSAGFGYRAATIKVSEIVDQTMADLQRQSRWTAKAALAAALAVLLQGAALLTGF